MTPIIVLDSSDEETEPNEKSSKKTLPIILQRSKAGNNSKRNSSNSSILSIKKPDWSKFQNNNLPIKILNKEHPEKSQQPAKIAGDNSSDVTPNKEVAVVVAKQSESNTTPNNKRCATPSSINRVEIPETSSSRQTIRNGELSTVMDSVVENSECSSVKGSSRSSTPQQNALKRKFSDSSDNSSERSMKRLRPTQISEKVDHSWVASQSPVIAIDEDAQKVNESDKPLDNNESTAVKPSAETPNNEEEEEENPVHPTFAALLEACKAADPSTDMDLLIKNKLLKYYNSVHPDFVVSKGFCKTVKAVTTEIQSMPKLVYYKLKNVVEELKIRRKSKDTVMSNEEITTTGNEKKDRQVKRLSKALYVMTKKIAKLEEADADLDDDNSSYLLSERYKKRACEIYEMICDLTGESKHAHRLVKKPIRFRGTSYSKFNRTLESFVNRTNTFPDFYDVFRCLEHCNQQYCFGLRNDDIRKIAQDAFMKVGKLLQNRRKTDLYETVSHFTGCSIDPADSDPNLHAKLNENKKFHTNISTIIDRFAQEQDGAATDNKKNKNKLQEEDDEEANNPKEESGYSSEGKKDEDETKKNNSERACNSSSDNEERILKLTDSTTVGENERNTKSPLNAKINAAAPKDNKSDSKSNSPTPSSSKNVEKAPATLVAMEEIIISDEEDS